MFSSNVYFLFQLCFNLEKSFLVLIVLVNDNNPGFVNESYIWIEYFQWIGWSSSQMIHSQSSQTKFVILLWCFSILF